MTVIISSVGMYVAAIVKNLGVLKLVMLGQIGLLPIRAADFND